MSNPIPLSGAPRGAGQFFLYSRTADDTDMRCSVVIPCHNGAELTRACITSLLEQESPPLEILIVDNASSDDTNTLSAIAPSVRVISLPRNLGFAGGVNAGLREARGETVMIVNNDTQAARSLTREMHTVLDSDPRIGACAPVSNHVKGDAHLAVGAFGKEPGQRQELSQALQAEPLLQDADTLAGLCLLVRRSTLQEIGLFDERFGHGNYEDDDFCLRLRLHGYRLAIARRAFLHHEGHATFEALGLNIKDQIKKRLSQFRDKWQSHPAGLATLAGIHGNYALAHNAAVTAQRQVPNWLDADWHIGRHHELQGDAKLAIRHLRTFLEHCPLHVEARITLALALIRDGQLQLGQGVIEQTMTQHRPTQKQETQMLKRLGQLAYEAGQYKNAAVHLRTALEITPESGELHNWLGLCELATDNLTSALKAFTNATQQGFALGFTNLGICQSRLGQLDAAVQNFEEAVNRLPNDPVVQANYQAGVAALAGSA